MYDYSSYYSSYTDYCQLATTSSCPGGCRGPNDDTNIGQLDPNAKCHNDPVWNGGCMIKRGITLYDNIFSKIRLASILLSRSKNS